MALIKYTTVTSHAKIYTNGFPFLNGYPFTSRFSSVQLKFPSVRTAVSSVHKNCRTVRTASAPVHKNLHSFERLVPSVQKNCPSVRTPVASVQKNLHPFEQLGHPFRKIIHPFKTTKLEPFVQKPWIISRRPYMAGRLRNEDMKWQFAKSCSS